MLITLFVLSVNMSSNGNCFVEWKEQFVSQERGNRVVHYFLMNSSGESILAVVGTERSVRHMFYVVADEFLEVCGTVNSIQAGYKWRSRREVVDWLTSMLSEHHTDLSKSPRNDLTQASVSPDFQKTGSGAHAHIPDYTGQLGSNSKGLSSDIVWSGVAWTCGKQLKHFPAFCRNGTTIGIQSFIFVMAKEKDHYLAYMEDMYEDKKGLKKVKVRWFHRNQEVKCLGSLRNPHPKEVFITPYAQVISAECVDGPAIVLTPEHYETCIASFPHALLDRVHLCYRQFRNNRVKPFDLSKLRGYFDQTILCNLDASHVLKPNSIFRCLPEKEDDEFSPGDDLKKGAKRTRNYKGRQRFVIDPSGARLAGRGREMLTHGLPYKNSRFGLLGRKPLYLKNVKHHPLHIPHFKVDEKIELLCQDSGIRGCWFRCTVLLVSRKQMKVQYDDVQDEDGCGNLKEWIPAFRLAMPDKLGMRCWGRPAIRPAPPENQIDLAFAIGVPVDAWWSDGWWEGVVTSISNSGDDNLQVYFPGENLYLDLHKKNLRISRDWTGDQWVEIGTKPDILSVIHAAISPDSKLSTSSNVTKDPRSDGFATSHLEVPTSDKLNFIDDEKLNLSVLASSCGLLEGTDRDSDEKQPSLNEECNVNDVFDNNDDEYDGSEDDELHVEELETAKQNCEAV